MMTPRGCAFKVLILTFLCGLVLAEKAVNKTDDLSKQETTQIETVHLNHEESRPGQKTYSYSSSQGSSHGVQPQNEYEDRGQYARGGDDYYKNSEEGYQPKHQEPDYVDPYESTYGQKSHHDSSYEEKAQSPYAYSEKKEPGFPSDLGSKGRPVRPEQPYQKPKYLRYAYEVPKQYEEPEANKPSYDSKEVSYSGNQQRESDYFHSVSKDHGHHHAELGPYKESQEKSSGPQGNGKVSIYIKQLGHSTGSIDYGLLSGHKHGYLLLPVVPKKDSGHQNEEPKSKQAYDEAGPSYDAPQGKEYGGYTPQKHSYVESSKPDVHYGTEDDYGQSEEKYPSSGGKGYAFGEDSNGAKSGPQSYGGHKHVPANYGVSEYTGQKAGHSGDSYQGGHEPSGHGGYGITHPQKVIINYEGGQDQKGTPLGSLAYGGPHGVSKNYDAEVNYGPSPNYHKHHHQQKHILLESPGVPYIGETGQKYSRGGVSPKVANYGHVSHGPYHHTGASPVEYGGVVNFAPIQAPPHRLRPNKAYPNKNQDSNLYNTQHRSGGNRLAGYGHHKPEGLILPGTGEIHARQPVGDRPSQKTKSIAIILQKPQDINHNGGFKPVLNGRGIKPQPDHFKGFDFNFQNYGSQFGKSSESGKYGVGPFLYNLQSYPGTAFSSFDFPKNHGRFY